MLKKKEIILFVSMIILCVVAIVLSRQLKSDSTMVRISIGANVWGEYPLAEDQIINVDTTIGGHNVVVIKDGVVSVTEANCPDKICVYTLPMSKDDPGIGAICCLPNYMVIELVKDE